GCDGARGRSCGISSCCAHSTATPMRPLQLSREDSVNRTSRALVAFAVVLIAAPASAQTLPTAQHEMQSAQFLIGKWSCAHTVEGPSYPANGKRVTEHHTCRKVA